MLAFHARYEDYLDEQITPIDMYYLEDVDLARQLVELGCATLENFQDGKFHLAALAWANFQVPWER